MSEKGMTLIEVVVTVIILTMLASIATLSVGFYLNEGKTRVAEGELATLKAAARLYILDRGAAPSALTDLIPAYLPELPDDPFAAAGTSYKTATDATNLYIYSIGPNGIDNTHSDDDIVVAIVLP